MPKISLISYYLLCFVKLSLFRYAKAWTKLHLASEIPSTGNYALQKDQYVESRLK